MRFGEKFGARTRFTKFQKFGAQKLKHQIFSDIECPSGTQLYLVKCAAE
jgi:hypothetical protein